MNEEQFNNMMKILVQIEFNTRKEHKITEEEDIINRLRVMFHHKLEIKDIWTSYEIKDLFEESVEIIL